MIESQEVVLYRQEFDNFYQENLKQPFAMLEKSRKKYLKAFILSAIAVFAIVPLFILWQLDNITALLHQYQNNIDVDVLIGAYCALAGVVAIPISAYKLKNKKIIMPTFVKFFNTFDYRAKQSIDDYKIEQSMLFDNYDCKSGDDYFEGTYKDVNVIISEERLEKYVRTKNGKRKQTIFKGIFIALEMNKNFSTKTVGRKDKGFFNNFNRCQGLDNVKLEDIIFEKEWEIYSNDQIEARYLLTTAFMERLLRVKNLYQSSRLQFCFFENKLLMAIDMSHDMFETSSLFKCAFDKKHINQTLEQFLSVLSVVDILKLNKRIGM